MRFAISLRVSMCFRCACNYSDDAYVTVLGSIGDPVAVPPEMAVADLVWSIHGNEIAVNRIWLQHEHHDTVTFDWGDALQTIADKVVSSLSADGAGHSVMGGISSDCSLTRVDAYQIDETGHATDKRSHDLTGSPLQGGQGGNYSPLMSAVIQLWGYDPTGFKPHAKRWRGRIFSPCTPASFFTNEGMITTDSAGVLAGWWGSFLNDLQGMHVGESAGLPGGPTDSMNVGVLSRVDSAFRQMEAVTVALKPGIQRRRMNALPANRSSAVTINHS
jgi:hypothetical protein